MYMCVCIMDYYSVIKKKEILPFVTTWMDFKGIRLNEICERKKLCCLTYMWNLKNKQKINKLSSHIQRIDWWLPEAEGSVDKMSTNFQKVQTFKYKIH